MLMTCPHCRAPAKLAPNPSSNDAAPSFTSEPRYRLTCSGCAATTVGQLVDAEETLRRNILSAA